ncbi:MAG TPA: hypothetical protein PKH39_19285 [Woeseiaceae bacterium]|nr:hypothetical protein [Woeseiaceae bacterium]
MTRRMPLLDAAVLPVALGIVALASPSFAQQPASNANGQEIYADYYATVKSLQQQHQKKLAEIDERYGTALRAYREENVKRAQSMSDLNTADHKALREKGLKGAQRQTEYDRVHAGGHFSLRSQKLDNCGGNREFRVFTQVGPWTLNLGQVLLTREAAAIADPFVLPRAETNTSFDIITYNVALIIKGGRDNRQREYRAKNIGRRLHRYHVVVLNEAFHFGLEARFTVAPVGTNR